MAKKHEYTFWESKSNTREEVRIICDKLNIETGSGKNDALVEQISCQLPSNVTVQMEFKKEKKNGKIHVVSRVIGFKIEE